MVGGGQDFYTGGAVLHEKLSYVKTFGISGNIDAAQLIVVNLCQPVDISVN